ncbi:DUF2771 family protein [Saccharomonospora iraqiensis]|uniref:DUF2771 family protein n=1 Tax=Saccharomonospora iraqiensis TaxID=52698 RepID=UPI00022E1C71|nr:DUF2771 family protein [Saccharomonospora iraqiensis]
MRRKVVARVAPLAAGAAVLAGCSAPAPPEVTFYADGESVRAEPWRYCDAQVTSCESHGERPVLDVRAGEPVQISVPADVAETPWLVNVQYTDSAGTVRPIRQEVFTPGERHAYTAVPQAPAEQLLVVEVQQLGGAYAADAQGNPIVDESGRPQLVARAVWALRIDPS